MDGMLGGIATIDVGRDKLVLQFPRVFNGGLAVGADLVSRIWRSTFDRVVGSQSMFVGPVQTPFSESLSLNIEYICLCVLGCLPPYKLP